MKIRIDKSYIKYIFIVFILLIDSLILLPIGSNKTQLFLFLSTNISVITLISFKTPAKFNIKFSFFIMIFLSYFIEIYIHYMQKKVFLEAEYLYLIPLLIAFLKTKNCEKKFMLITNTFLIFNFIILIFNKNFSFFLYFKSIVPIITFIIYYLCIKELNQLEELLKIFKFIFVISFMLTLIQTILGFHQDTRNGVFGVFGLNAYTFMIICYPTYNLYCWLKKQKKLTNLLFSILISILLFICTENKASIILILVALLILIVIDKNISLKKISIIVFVLLLIPISYKMLIRYYPKFQFLNNMNSISNYFLGNNNWSFRYGRFESLKIVYNNAESSDKIIGRGIGTSTPYDKVFYDELGLKNTYPYYIQLYGYKHGFHLTSISTILLDGGIVYLILIVIFIINNFVNSIKIIKSNREKSFSGYVTISAIIVGLFYLIYSNIFTNYRTMAIIAIILGLNKIQETKEITEHD